MKPINILYYAVALIFPLVLFLEILDNANEKSWISVFAVVLPLFGLAGVLSSRPGADRWKWVGWSLVVGIVEACLLAFAF